MGTKWDLDVWQGEKGKSSPTVKVSCTEGFMIEIQWAEGWLKTVFHILQSVFKTWNLDCSYLQTPTSLKPVTAQVMVLLQWAQPWAQLPQYLSQNRAEALLFAQHSAEHIALQGWFSMGPPYVQHQLQKFRVCCSPACSHTHVVTFTVQGRITPGVTLSRSDRKTALEMLFTQKGVKSTGDLVEEAFLKQCHSRLLQAKKSWHQQSQTHCKAWGACRTYLLRKKVSILLFFCKSGLALSWR